jgi:hypothetical protein
VGGEGYVFASSFPFHRAGTATSTCRCHVVDRIGCAWSWWGPSQCAIDRAAARCVPHVTGDLDLASASWKDNRIAWYESDGAVLPNFTQRVVSNSTTGAYALVAVDLDQDGNATPRQPLLFRSCPLW